MSTRSMMNKELQEQLLGLAQVNEDRAKAGAFLKEESEAVKSVPKVELKPGEALYSTFPWGTSATGIDHVVMQYEDSVWHERVRPLIPPKNLSENYIWPNAATEYAIVGMQNGDKVFLTGPKGTGKSTLYEMICSVLRIPFVRIPCREDMESNAFFGDNTVRDGSLVWEDGGFTDVFKHGGVCQSDEISAVPSGIALSLQWPLEKGGKLYLSEKAGTTEDKLVNPNDKFCFVATDNTVLQGDPDGKYVGTQPQNMALIDRLSMTIELDYLGKAHERAILKKLYGKDFESHGGEKMLEVAAMLRRANLQFGVSIRTLIDWVQKTILFKDEKVGLRVSFYNKLTEEDRKITAEVFQKVFGRSL